MTAFDPATLPSPLAQYFATPDHRQTIGLFARDARVLDEGAVHIGIVQIAAWLESVDERYSPRYRVLSAQTQGTRTAVRFEVSGTFAGSPATLQQAIEVENGLIRSLETL